MKDKLPEDVTGFAIELGRLCASHDMSTFSGKFTMGISSKLAFDPAISFTWEAGRYGAESNAISVSVTLQETVKWEPTQTGSKEE